MKKKNFFIFIILTVICLIFLFSCKPPEESVEPLPFTPFTEEAGKAVFINHLSTPLPLSMTDSLDIGSYALDSMDTELGLIVITRPRTGIEGEDKGYAVVDMTGNYIIPFAQDSYNDYLNISIKGNIITARDLAGKFAVFNSSGTILLPATSCVSVEYMSRNHFRVNYESRSQIYTSSGEAIFKVAQTMPYVTDTIYSCGTDYLTVETEDGKHYILNSNATLNKEYTDNDSTKYKLFYLGNSKFLIIKDITVGSSEAYDVIIDEKYIDQKVYIYNAAEKSESEKQTGDVYRDCVNGYMADVLNDYIVESYSYIKAYNLNEDKKLNSYVPYIDYVIDTNLNYCIKLDDNLYNVIKYTEWLGLEQTFMNKGRLVLPDGNTAWESTEAINIVKYYNDGMLVAGKSVDYNMYYGAFNSSGTLSIQFEYDKLTPFAGGWAVGQIEDQYYRVSNTGTRIEIEGDVIAEDYFYGYYLVKSESGIYSVYNNAGTRILSGDRNVTEIVLSTSKSGVLYAAAVNLDGHLIIYTFG